MAKSDHPTYQLSEGSKLDDEYVERFDEYPPIAAWEGTQAALDKLMREAIARGRPLTEDDLWAAQGLLAPPEHAKW